jgi:homocysteine S-methyltransferase
VVHSRSNLFEKALCRNFPVVLDGGLATELESQGFDIGTRLWSAGLLQSDPSAIVAAHCAYLEAGAEIIISASYQASQAGLMSLGLSEQQADDLIVSSVELACTARKQFLDKHPETTFTPIVAASIGPYGAVLHDGSEYTGNYDIDEASLRRFHEHRLTLLDQTDADVLACETIPNKLEANALCELLTNVRLPAWVSFSCCDGRCISDGTPLQQIVTSFRGHPRVLALGVNCTAAHFITSLIGEIKAGAADKAVIVYPNSGETYDVCSNSWLGSSSPVECAAAAQSWRDAGAKIIGGCCRIGPRHIAALREQLTA